MTWDQALQIIIEDGIELGAGDYVDLETLKLAAKASALEIALGLSIPRSDQVPLEI